MTKFEILKRILGACALSVAAVGFAGSACEKQNRTNPVTETAQQVPNPTHTGSQTAAQNDVVKPDDVGPAAPALFVVSGLKGYTEPCGCTIDIMLGGIDRIVRYANDASKLYPASALVDGGDLFFEHAKYDDAQLPQERARSEVVVAALTRLKPVFTVPGELDFALGADYYTQIIGKSGIKPYGGNLVIKGETLPASKVVELDGKRVLLIAVVEPALYEGLPDLKISDPDSAIADAIKVAGPHDVEVIVAHGGLAFVKERLVAHPSIDFGVVGHNPRETDQVDAAGGGYTLEAHDQGRYFGILKLYVQPNDETFVNASEGSKAELENIQKQIAHVDDSLQKMPPATQGNESPMVLSLRKRLTELNGRLQKLKNASVAVPLGESSFLWRSIAMEPGLQVDADIETTRLAYNKSLKALSLTVERVIPPVAAGEAFYIGTDQCATCHAQEYGVWQTTAHSRAWETLTARDKDFDQSCVGCHSVGYEKPGGSVVGQFQYPASLQAEDTDTEVKWEKDLRNVGCENCHGPGSLHRLAPVDEKGVPQHISKGSGAQTCMQCHVPAHSPRFDYETYVPRITGKGHPLSSR